MIGLENLRAMVLKILGININLSTCIIYKNSLKIFMLHIIYIFKDYYFIIEPF